MSGLTPIVCTWDLGLGGSFYGNLTHNYVTVKENHGKFGPIRTRSLQSSSFDHKTAQSMEYIISLIFALNLRSLYLDL